MPANRLMPVPNGHDDVLAIIKTPGMPRPATVRVPAKTTIADSLQVFLQQTVTTDDERRIAEHLRREIMGPHNFFAITARNSMVEVKPSTTLSEIAVPRELQFPEGPKEVPCAAVEVVQYASVGYTP